MCYTYVFLFVTLINLHLEVNPNRSETVVNKTKANVQIAGTYDHVNLQLSGLKVKRLSV